MYSQRDPYAESLGSVLVQIALVLVLIGIFVMVVTAVFVVTTFVEHYKHKSLWIALAVCVALGVGGVLLHHVSSASLALVGIGIAVLLITCLVVNLKNRDTLMRENVNLIDEVLHTSWWGSEDTPQTETVHEQLAA